MEISPWSLPFNLLFTSMLIVVVLAADPYSKALLSLKSEIIDGSNSLDDWKVPPGETPSGKVHACSWSGVKCNKNSTIVVGLNLGMKNLAGELLGNQLSVFTQLVELNVSQNAFSGELPVEIFNLSKLTTFDISGNNFSGRFPNGITGLKKLVVLDALSNSFSGPLPVEVTELESLKVLNLAGNSLTGKIPPELGKLKTVTHMEIGYNFYEGSIPWELSNMTELQYLDIAGANLSGSIPKQLCNLSKLESLFLFRNQLMGSIPWEFSQMVSLINLDLSDNLISGPIPESFGELKKLKLLSLMFNEMNGTVPDTIAELPSMETLFIWNNFFTGSLPENLGRLSRLRWLDVSNNSFVGSIPPGVCAGGVVILIAATVSLLIHLRKGSKGQWKMNSFIGLPQFTANDVLRSFNATDSKEELPPFSGAFCKAVLPTGITVLVKKLEWEPKRVKIASEFITQLGNSRHMNLIRLLGFCYNNQLTYLLYDCLPNGNLAEKLRMQRDWGMKCRIIIGIAKGLCFLHHDCNPAIPHGDLKSSNVMFDDNFEPRLADFGFKHLIQLIKGTVPATSSRLGTGEFNDAIKDELYKDIYNFGELILEILTNGKVIKGGASIQSKPKDVVLREMYDENEAGSTNSLQEDEMKQVVDVALLCTKSRAVDRPSIEDALKLLSGLKANGK
ncbi:hypothetical protein V6Z11_A06G111000 [Gossypium hirsutum]